MEHWESRIGKLEEIYENIDYNIFSYYTRFKNIW